jgi:2-oxoglutarate ferredoxin oxidoreductase subunit gamma
MGNRFEVIMAGIGGQGVLTAVRILAEAAVDTYEYVTWMSTYRAARRGGASECTVILSKSEIASFLLSKTDILLIMASSQMETFMKRLRAGGLLIYDPSGLPKEPGRSDIELFPVDAVEVAKKLGAIQAANVIFLGAYIGITGALPPELISRKLESSFEGKSLLLNKEAFARGLGIGKGKPSR